tara:strand:+ start:51 stop:419 length:369 start_codon:yes stop_codon:yes gene_type:complete
MSYYGIDEVMDKLKDIEKKIDKVMEYNNIGLKNTTLTKREEVLLNPPLYDPMRPKQEEMDLVHYKYHHTYQEGNKMAQVALRNDGVWCVEKFVDNTLIERVPLEGKAEIYAENAAENFVLGI